MNATRSHWWLVNVGPGNGLVPSGSKTFPEPMLVQVMVWCCQAARYYLNQCWPSSKTPYGTTRPQWVKRSNSIGYWHRSLQWCHNERDGVSNHQPHDCLLNRYSGADHRKHQSSASLAFVWGIHRWSVNYPHKGPVTRKMFPFGYIIMDALSGSFFADWNSWRVIFSFSFCRSNQLIAHS